MSDFAEKNQKKIFLIFLIFGFFLIIIFSLHIKYLHE